MKSLSIISVIMLIALCVVSCDSNTTTTSLKSIEVTTKPTKLTYTVGESLNTADMVLTATYTNGTSKVVTGFTVDTTVLSTVGTKTVTVSFTQNGVTKTASFDVTVNYPPFTVTFVKNDASAKNLDFESMTVDYGSTYKTLPSIEKDNYTFLGWYDAPSGGNKVTADTTVTKASNHNLYAQWIENGKFRVTFKCEDNDNPTETVPADITGYLEQKIILPGNVGTVPLTKTGYTFNGWAPKDESYNSGAFITASKERLITLYAQWKANTYTVHFDKNDSTATGAMDDQYFVYNEIAKALTTNTFTKANYSFEGWATTADGAKVYDDGQSVQNLSAADNDTIILYAKWTAITTFNINGKYVGGTPSVAGTTDNKKITNDEFKLPGVVYYSGTDQTKGFAVTKWNTKDDGTGTDYNAGAVYTPSAGQTLYAISGHTWVQLWSGGPKFAEFNVGSTITDYKDANSTSATATEKYATAYVGEYYKWGAIAERNEGTAAPSSVTADIQYSETYDTARNIWGSNWKMPKRDDFINLTAGLSTTMSSTESNTGTNSIWTWCDGVVHTADGDGHMQYVEGCTVKGYEVKGIGDYADNSIFLPAAGYYDDSGLHYQGTYGRYWSSTFYDSFNASFLKFSSDREEVASIKRKNGFSVRAILVE